MESLIPWVVDEKIGLIRKVITRRPDPGDPPVFTAASRGFHKGISAEADRLAVDGGAIALSEDHARLAAICEGIERYCLFAGDPASFLVDSYANLSRRFTLLHSSACPLFHPSQYPDVGYDSFEETTPLAWTWGVSLFRQKPLLVPADLIYLGNKHDAGEAVLCNPISTGAACGVSYADAVVRGIYEVVERDAFMIMWLNQHPCPRLRISPASKLGRLLQSHFKTTNLSHEFIWMTNDLAIHACMAILLEGERGARRAYVGLAAHLDPQQAAQKALMEAYEVRLYLLRSHKTMPVVRDTTEITDIHRHAYYYAQGDRTSMLDFLLQNSNEVPLDELENTSQGHPAADLQICLEKCAQAGEEVIVADLTQEEIRSLGLRVVRVIMPGMQRLTCEHNKPYLGGSRLYEVPVRLGWRTSPIEIQEINRDPHPFI
jgi:ribosomal protein S12 methylthiotransferase accessory factor